MFLSLIHMFGFWCQILVQLAYDFGARFQTYLSEKEICVATSYYKMKKDIRQQLQYTIQLKPRIIGSTYNRLKFTISSRQILQTLQLNMLTRKLM